MKKIWTSILSVALALVMLLCVGCTPKKTDYDGTEVQGVSDTEIIVGNTAATTGSFAKVGLPFNAALEAVLYDYNQKGGYNGKNVRLIHYDDGFDGAVGLTYTKRLVEDDKVFALVGHFGTNTVSSTIDYIKEEGVPMVYAATGISDLYQEQAKGFERAVMPVQPIYDTEGRMLLARALGELKGRKVGVLYTTDDAGEGIKKGIDRQAKEIPNKKAEVFAQGVEAGASDFSAAMNALKSKNCDVIIAACNQDPLKKVLSAMNNANYDVPVITSYVNANAVTLGEYYGAGLINENRPVYTNAWLDTTTLDGFNDYVEFAAVMTAYDKAKGNTLYDDAILNLPALYPEKFPDGKVSLYYLDSYAMAGYLAADIFVEGLERVKAAGEELTWLNFVDAMEKEDFDLKMGGSLSFKNGSRVGITSFALNVIKKNVNAETGAITYALQAAVEGESIVTLDTVWDRITF